MVGVVKVGIRVKHVLQAANALLLFGMSSWGSMVLFSYPKKIKMMMKIFCPECPKM